MAFIIDSCTLRIRRTKFCMFWLKKNAKHKDNFVLAEMVECFFAVPWAGHITARDSVPLTLVGLQHPFFTSGHAFNSYRQKSQNYSANSQCKYMPWFAKLSHICPFLIKKGHILVKTGAELPLRNKWPSNGTLVLLACSLRILLIIQFLGFRFFLMDSNLFFSLIPMQKRVGLGSATLPFQQFWATGDPALSTSAVLSSPSVPAMEHHLLSPPSVHRGGYSVQQP